MGKKCDLVLSMGTSMCGMNSDRVFTTCSKKHCEMEILLGASSLICSTQFDHLSAFANFCSN